MNYFCAHVSWKKSYMDMVTCVRVTDEAGKTQDWARNERRLIRSTADGLDEVTSAHRWRSAWC